MTAATTATRKAPYLCTTCRRPLVARLRMASWQRCECGWLTRSVPHPWDASSRNPTTED